MRVTIDGRLADDVDAKDLILAIIGRWSAEGGAGHVIEFAGSAVRALGMEARMTLCNLAVEFGARFGLIAGPTHSSCALIRPSIRRAIR